MRKIKWFFRWSGILFIGIILFACSPSVNDENYIAYINGEGISIKMFNQQIAEHKASVYSQFSQSHVITDQAKFWHTSFSDNEIPAEVLKKKALEECMRIVTQQILAKQKGLLDDISYDGFIKKLRVVNDSRKQAVNEKKVIYGPIEYTESMYFDHLLGLIVIDLKSKLAAEEFKVTEGKLKEFYYTNKEILYRTKDVDNMSEYYPFDSIKSVVRSNFIDYQYDQLIDNLLLSAEVSINDKLYKSVSIE